MSVASVSNRDTAAVYRLRMDTSPSDLLVPVDRDMARQERVA